MVRARAENKGEIGVPVPNYPLALRKTPPIGPPRRPRNLRAPPFGLINAGLKGFLRWTANSRKFNRAPRDRRPPMTRLITLMFLGALTLSGCAVALGGAAAIVADEAAEREGGNLF